VHLYPISEFVSGQEIPIVTHMKTVLVADGVAGGRELLRILLEHEGYTVLEAKDSQEALAVARASSPDIILLDVELVDGESCTAVREMRRDQLLKDRAIIAVTANTRHADREELIKAGFTGYIAKPVVLRTLREQLSELCASRPEARR